MSNLLLLPVIVPLATVLILLLAHGRKWLQQIIGIGGIALQFTVAVWIFVVVNSQGIQVIQLGSWPAPFGITFVADLFSSIMLMVAALIGLMTAIYAMPTISDNRQRFSYYPLVNAMLMGVNGAFLTGDVFNLYVWFEVMIMASFVLLTLGGSRQQMNGAIKYVAMNLVASMLFLAGIGLLYGQAGTLNMADLALKIRASDDAFLLNSSAMLFFVAFSLKAALFPFFFWLPASYPTAPMAITAFFSGLLTKVGVYALIRFFTLFFVQNQSFWHPLLLWAGGITMLVGVLTAASQYDMRRILSFHIISQIGYIIMGLGLFTVAGIAGAIYYMVHNIVAKANTFLVAGMVYKLRGTYDLKAISGLYKNYPLVALLFVIPAMGLAGVPPFSGFVGKLMLVVAGFEAEKWVITGVALLVGLFTLFSMVKIWNEGFWKKHTGNDASDNKKLPVAMLVPVAILALITILLGVAAEPVVELCMRAAHQLIDPSSYIEAVLGKQY
ncbi:MAG: Na+/H+ antiporter subunit D [Clostridia bacterium]|nr:Na+/H+ antiporter subunit D [Clostridia bacterium]